MGERRCDCLFGSASWMVDHAHSCASLAPAPVPEVDGQDDSTPATSGASIGPAAVVGVGSAVPEVDVATLRARLNVDWPVSTGKAAVLELIDAYEAVCTEQDQWKERFQQECARYDEAFTRRNEIAAELAAERAAREAAEARVAALEAGQIVARRGAARLLAAVREEMAAGRIGSRTPIGDAALDLDQDLNDLNATLGPIRNGVLDAG
jgi:hypothetical protein